MTLNEFRAWLEGFETGFDRSFERPNSEQWTAIKAKLALVDAPKAAALIHTPREWSPGWPPPEKTRKWGDIIWSERYSTPQAGDGYATPSKTTTAAASLREADDRN